MTRAGSGSCGALITRVPGAGRFPAAFVELGESVEDAACRETRGELEIEVELGALVGVYSRAEDGSYSSRSRRARGVPREPRRATEVRAFAPADLPWDELSFWSTTRALRDLLAAG